MSTKAQSPDRFEFVDAMRGLAVVFMLCMHTGDGWLQPALRHGAGWEMVRAVGGLAAPLFLLLAGVSLGLGSVSRPRPLRVDVARGLQILVLGYLLRVQMWMLDGGGYRFSHHWLAALPLVAGYALALLGLGRWATGRPRARAMVVAAVPCMVLGIHLISIWIPRWLVGVLRVDVLQGIGASIVLVSVAVRLARGRSGPILALGVAVALLTPWFRSWVPGPLPGPVAAYLGYWYPGPGLSPAGMFPLFPWFAYVCFGLVLGRHWGRLGPRAATESAVVLCATGALLALAACEAVAPVNELLRSWPDLVQPARVAYRTGACLVVAGLAVVVSRAGAPVSAPLNWLGRASLMVYWVHLELAFGMAGRPLVRQLDFAGWAAGFAVLTGVMAGLSWLWLKPRRTA